MTIFRHLLVQWCLLALAVSIGVTGDVLLTESPGGVTPAAYIVALWSALVWLITLIGFPVMMERRQAWTLLRNIAFPVVMGLSYMLMNRYSIAAGIIENPGYGPAVDSIFGGIFALAWTRMAGWFAGQLQKDRGR